MKKTFIDKKLMTVLEKFSIAGTTMTRYGDGERKTNKLGNSMEFSSMREYIPGDDFRRIDWNAYARSEKIYTKEFHEESVVCVNLIIDTSRSMDFGNFEKIDMAKYIASLLGYVSLKSADKLSVYFLDGNDYKTMHFNHKNDFGKLIKVLTSINIDYKSEAAFDKKVIRRLKKGVTILISDFIDEFAQNFIKQLRYEGHRVHGVCILSKEEADPQMDGKYKLIDSENGKAVDVDMDESVVTMYKSKLNEHIMSLKNEVKYARGAFTLITDDISEDDILYNNLVKNGILR